MCSRRARAALREGVAGAVATERGGNAISWEFFPHGFRPYTFSRGAGGAAPRAGAFGFNGLGQMAGFVDPHSGIAAACLVNQLSAGERVPVAAEVLKFVTAQLGAGEFDANGMFGV